MIPTAKFSFASSGRLFTPASLASLYAWYDARDNTYMTVNSDGTGGVPADEGTVGRLTDRGANGKHLTQAVAANQPVYRAGKGLNCFWKTDGGTVQANMANSAYSISTQNCSGGGIFDLTGTVNVPVIILDTSPASNALCIYAGGTGTGDPGATGAFIGFLKGGGFTDTGTLIPSGRKLVLTFRSNSSNLIIRCNGVEYSTTAAVADTIAQIRLGTFGGGSPKPVRLYELAIYDEDIGLANIVSLERYLRANAGSFDPTRTVATYGDSMAMGVGSNILKPWHDYVTNRSGSKWFSFNADGYYLTPQHVNPTQLNAMKGSTEGVVVIWAGTNDILIGTTGANLEAAADTFCTALQAGGNKVVIATLQHFATNNAERINFNTALKANYSNYADAIVLLDEAPELDDATDTTYYTSDGVHLKDAGHAAAGALFQTALAALA